MGTVRRGGVREAQQLIWVLCVTGHWKALEQLLQPGLLTSLGQCQGLVPLLAHAEQHALLHHILPHVSSHTSVYHCFMFI